MKDDKITALILSEIEKRGIIWKDMVGGRSISLECGDQKVFRINLFKFENWSDRLIELICKGPYDPDADSHVWRIKMEDLMRFWWDHCIDQDDMLDRILEDVFVHFKDQLLPKRKPQAVIQYDVNFAKVIPKPAYSGCIGSGCNDFKNDQQEESKMKQVMVTVCKGLIDQVLFFEDEAKALMALEQFVKHMNEETQDAGVYGPDGLIANAKMLMDE